MFDWAYLDPSGEEMGRSPRFADADQAEDWIGSSWPDLLEHGVEAVVLYDHSAGRKLYRMGLGSD